jgi:hypothetical protein
MAETMCTCHTRDCPNNGIEIPMTLSGTDPDTGEEWSVGSVQCGGCGQEITDLGQDVDNELPEEPPNRVDNELPETAEPKEGTRNEDQP